MKNKELLSEKVKLTFELISKTLLTYIILIIVWNLFIDGLFERYLANSIYDFNHSFYYWCVNYKTEILFVYIFLVIVIVSYRFISKKIDDIHKVYKSLDNVMNENSQKIELSKSVIKFSEKLNEIKYNYILNKKNAIEAEQKKNDLIIYMAHDLKTPLTSIIGYLTLLTEEEQISKELQDKYMNIALNKALRVEDLTNQFFDITRYNLQKMPITKQKIDLSFLLDQLVEECYPMLMDKNLQYKINKPDHIYFIGDGDKLARAFDNLLKNAINYTYENSVIEICMQEDSEKVKIKFRNKGDKIPEYKLEKIFEKFYRLDESRNSNTGGAGLGLAITKEIIELHDGNIIVKNDDEHIEFCIELPCQINV